MLVHHRVTPHIKFASAPLYTWVERGTLRVKFPAQKQNTMSHGQCLNPTSQPWGERTDHDTTSPLQ